MNDAIRSIQLSIETQQVRIKNLEDRLSGAIIPQGDDGYVVDKINYHLGVLSGLRQSLTILTAHMEA